MQKLVMFDFDGVLVDSFVPLYRINQLGAAKFNKTISAEEYRSCFSGNIHEKIKKFYDLDEENDAKLVAYKRSVFPQEYNVKTVPLFDFSKELVSQLAENHKLVIVTSSPPEAVKGILENAGLEKFFTEISGFNKGGKNLTFARMKEIYKDCGQIFFITDTIGDIEEAKKTDFPIFTIGVPWGFHTPEELAAAGASVVVKNSEEIIDYIN